MAFYDDMAAMATELLTEFGALVTINRDTLEDINPETFAEDTAPTTTAYTPYGVITEYNSHQIDGTIVQSGDRLLILDDTLTPLQGDRVTVNGEGWNIVNWETISPAGTDVVYMVQVRR